MDYIIPVSEVRANLPGWLKKIRQCKKRLVITKNGRAQAVVLSPEELETLEIRSDRNLMMSLARALQDEKFGKLVPHRSVFGNV